jgi:hypothetical protein
MLFVMIAGGFVKALGQLGGAFAGAPLSALAGTYGWVKTRKRSLSFGVHI